MAGGTGGHVFPALVIAKKLQEYNAQVFWLGTRRGLEAELVPQAGLPIYYISIAGLRRRGIWNILLFPLRMFIACLQVFWVFLKVKPNCVLGMGGFVSAPGGIVAWLLRKPLIIHEQNAIMGMTNKILSKLATKIFLAFSSASQQIKIKAKTPSKVEIIGNPVRKEIIDIAPPSQRLSGRSGPLRLLVLGGSLGALALNKVFIESLAGIAEENYPIVWHQTGQRNIASTKELYKTLYKTQEVKIMPFINDMVMAYTWADCVLCRAGAMTISELMAVGVASILVPYPFAVDDHQTHNTTELVKAGGAICIQQCDLSAAFLTQLLTELSANREKLLEMAQAARDLNNIAGDAAQKVAKNLILY